MIERSMSDAELHGRLYAHRLVLQNLLIGLFGNDERTANVCNVIRQELAKVLNDDTTFPPAMRNGIDDEIKLLFGPFMLTSDDTHRDPP